MTAKLTGDWTGAFLAIDKLSKFSPLAKAVLDESGDLVLEKIQSNITNQSLGWTPLSSETIRIKGGSTILVETGSLKDSFAVRKSGSGIVVAVSGTSSRTGIPMTQLLAYHEYGTSRTPARPIVKPTWEQVEGEVKQLWENFLKDIVGGI